MNKEGKKEKKGFVSIVIPVYNMQKKIVKCLQSICNQSYQNFEILCIDDGSTDSTIAIIKKLAQKDCRIQLIQKEHGGQGSARNYGISKAKGEYILFIDSDDVIAEEMLSVLRERAIKDDADVVICGIHLKQNKKFICNYVVNDFAGSREEFMNERFKESYEKWLINAPWNKLIKKELLLRYNLKFAEDMKIYEDLLFSLEVIQHARRISVVSQPFYTYYYMQQGSVLSTFNENVDRYIERVGDKLEEVLPKYQLDMSYYYADLIHKKIVYALSIKKYKGFSVWEKIKRICFLFSEEKTREYLKKAKTENKVLKRKLFLMKRFGWAIKVITKLCWFRKSQEKTQL